MPRHDAIVVYADAASVLLQERVRAMLRAIIDSMPHA